MKNEGFDEYLKEFKKLSLIEKKSILLEQLKVLSGVTNELCKDIGAPNELLINKELVDVMNKDYSDDDYVEALIVMVNSIQNSIIDFHLHLAGIIKKFNSVSGDGFK